MAADWIKMRDNLWNDPRVAKICDLTGHPEAMIIGGLYWLWSMADQHTETGLLPGLSLKQVDRKSGVAGLGDALCEIGWVADHPEGIRILRFDEHNGSSAKHRASEAKRKADARNVSAKCPDFSGQNPDKSGQNPELEKEKEKEKELLRIRNLDVKERVEVRASRLPDNWQATDEQITFCKTERPDLDAHVVGDRFRDYWKAIGGAKGRKTDWNATWRNWVRNERSIPHARASPGYETAEDKRRKFMDELTGRNKNDNSDDYRTIDAE